MLASAVTYAGISRDMDRTLSRIGEQPMAKREITYYRENIGNVKSIDEFLKDRRLFSFAMRAYGLSDMTYAKAFMRKVLEEGVDERDSFANSLSDNRYREFAQAFNFKAFGPATTSFDRTQGGVIDKYVRQTLEEQSGQENEGVRLALYFERKAGSINNYFEVLAEPALSQVVRVAFGLPDAIAATDIEKQRDLLSSRMEIEELKGKEGTEKIIRQFLAFWDMRNTAPTTAPGLLTLGASPVGVDTSLLLNIQQLKGSR